MKGRKLAAMLAAATIITALGCSTAGQEAGLQEIGLQEVGITEIQQANGKATQGGQEKQMPIFSTSRVNMTPQEIRNLTGDYMAVTLWAHVAGETARNNPDDFHQMLFSDPDRECVEAHRDLLEVTPEPPVEKLISCGQESAAMGRDNVWAEISDLEREARARRAVGLLFWSIDPPSMMTVQIAHEKGLEVNAKTNPAFARFANKYDICEGVSQEFVPGMTEAETPRDIASIWMLAEQKIKECLDIVTSDLFIKQVPTHEHDLDGHDLEGHDLDGHDLDGHDLDGHDLDGHDLDGH